MSEFITHNPVRAGLFAWIAIISIISACVCIYDKEISKRNDVKLRIRERTLFVILPILGGGFTMFVTMMAVRHKTKHWQTYVLIPFFTLLWCAVILAVYYFKIY